MLPKTLLASALLFVSPSLAEAKSASTSSAADQSSPTGSVAASGTQAAAAADPAAPMTNAERDALLQEIRDLKKRTEALEARAAASAQVAVPPPPSSRKPGDHNLELYGFVQLDAIQDFKRVNPDWDATLRPSRIPTQDGQFGGDGQSVFSVRQSRLGAKATGIARRQALRGEVRVRPVRHRGRCRTDDVPAPPRLRQVGSVPRRPDQHLVHGRRHLPQRHRLLGADGDGLRPHAADSAGPSSNGDGWKAAVALEHPSDDIDPGSIRLIDEDIAANIQGDEELPGSYGGGPLRRRLGPRPARAASCARSATTRAEPRTMSPTATRPAGVSMRPPRSSSAWRRRASASSTAAASPPT